MKGKLTNNNFLYIILILLLSACSNDEEPFQEEIQNLEELAMEITSLAESVSCDDSSEWTFTSYGSKPCGGPWGYIAYSLNIDTTEFLKLVEKHRKAQKAFNEGSGIGSDCSLPTRPKDVICENGKPVFEY